MEALSVDHITIPYSEFDCSYVRSSGPGGQNVNKVNSKCVLRWSVRNSPSIPIEVLTRFLARFQSKITAEGEIILTSDRHRDQKRNFEDCIAKLKEMMTLVARPPRARKKTKPTRSSKKKRLESKRIHSDKKALRKKF